LLQVLNLQIVHILPNFC